MVCKNCNSRLEEACKFCFTCGAKIIKNRLTPRVLIKQMNEEFWTVDNKFVLTFLALFKKPEAVINGYISGTRKRYIGTIPYYALSLTILGFQFFLLQNIFPDFLTSQTNALLGSLPNNQIPKFNEQIMTSMDQMNDYIGIITSILVPFLALGTWIIFLDKRQHNYTEHLVINLYANAQLLIANFILVMTMAVFGISDFITISMLTTPLTIIYTSYIFKKIYKIGYFNALVRFLGAFFIYLISFGILAVIAVLLILLYVFATSKL